MSYKVFIDLKSKDKDLGKDLSRKLEKAGVIVLPLENIEDETDFKIKKDGGLLQADEVIFLLTPNSVNSRRFVFDMGVATSMEKPVTVITQGVETRELPPIIKETTRFSYADLGKFISRLQKHNTARQRALQLMKEALGSKKFTWRSIPQLAEAGGVSESEALKMLEDDPDVVIGKGKPGKIAKLSLARS